MTGWSNCCSPSTRCRRAGVRWDERLAALAAGIRDTARRHPAVFPLLLTRPAVTPAARVVRDTVQSALREGGLPEAEVARAERLISTAVLGFAASEAAGRFRQHDQSVIDADFAELLRWLRLSLAVPWHSWPGERRPIAAQAKLHPEVGVPGPPGRY